MDALEKRTESFWTLTWLPYGCSAKTDGIFLDVNMVAIWMLCKNGRTLCGRYNEQRRCDVEEFVDVEDEEEDEPRLVLDGSLSGR